jgi:hypothetical protein
MLACHLCRFITDTQVENITSTPFTVDIDPSGTNNLLEFWVCVDAAMINWGPPNNLQIGRRYDAIFQRSDNTIPTYVARLYSNGSFPATPPTGIEDYFLVTVPDVFTQYCIKLPSVIPGSYVMHFEGALVVAGSSQRDLLWSRPYVGE